MYKNDRSAQTLWHGGRLDVKIDGVIQMCLGRLLVNRKKKGWRKSRLGCRVDQSSFWDLSRQVLALSSFRRCLCLFNSRYREMPQNLRARTLFRTNALENAVDLRALFALYLHCGALLMGCIFYSCLWFSGWQAREQKTGRCRMLASYSEYMLEGHGATCSAWADFNVSIVWKMVAFCHGTLKNCWCGNSVKNDKKLVCLTETFNCIRRNEVFKAVKLFKALVLLDVTFSFYKCWSDDGDTTQKLRCFFSISFWKVTTLSLETWRNFFS